MKFLKGLALALLGLLLFSSLFTFSLAFMLNNTVLNPDFITAELNRLDISPLAQELLDEQLLQEGIGMTMVKVLPRLEPGIKRQTSAAIGSIYDYLLDNSQDLDLALILRNTLLEKDFVISVMDEIDISSLAGELLKEKLSEMPDIPPDMRQELVEFSEKAIVELKPWLSEQINAAADPVLDYLVGKRTDLKVVLSLEPVKETLKKNLKETLLKSASSPLVGMPAEIPQAEFDRFFDQFWQQTSAQIPATFEINSSLLGAEIPARITQALSMAEERLSRAKQYVGYFQLIYKALIGLILLLILAIILISRQVKYISRHLGTTFLTLGAMELIGIIVTKYLAQKQLPLVEMPPALQTWLIQFINNLLTPLQTLSLGLLIGGIGLLIVSFVYKGANLHPESS